PRPHASDRPVQPRDERLVPGSDRRVRRPVRMVRRAHVRAGPGAVAGTPRRPAGSAVSDRLAVAIDAAVWATCSAVVGYSAHRLPLHRLARDGPLTRLRPWERSGRAYERVGIRRWKAWLPEFGAVFRGGVSKRALPSRSTTDLARFA